MLSPPRQIAEGTQGLIPMGNTGEFPATIEDDFNAHYPKAVDAGKGAAPEATPAE